MNQEIPCWAFRQFTGKQCKAARGALGWSFKTAARIGQTSVATLHKFEHGGTVNHAVLEDLAEAYKAAGVRFMPPTKHQAAGIAYRPPID